MTIKHFRVVVRDRGDNVSLKTLEDLQRIEKLKFRIEDRGDGRFTFIGGADAFMFMHYLKEKYDFYCELDW